jgi:hypothetical protein
LNFTRKTDIGFTREIQRGIPSSTNEFTYNIFFVMFFFKKYF